jgi:hypothetical protein
MPWRPLFPKDKVGWFTSNGHYYGATTAEWYIQAIFERPREFLRELERHTAIRFRLERSSTRLIGAELIVDQTKLLCARTDGGRIPSTVYELATGNGSFRFGSRVWTASG